MRRRRRRYERKEKRRKERRKEGRKGDKEQILKKIKLTVSGKRRELILIETYLGLSTL